jgi:plastocyanin
MNRRITVALGVTAALGLGVAPAAGAAKNDIQIVGGVVVKPGQFVKDDQRFRPINKTVKSGSTVRVVNKARTQDPHTITFIAKRFLPKQFESGLEQQIFTAHGVDPDAQDAPPANLVVDNGQAVPQGGTLEVDTGFTKTVMGDSAFIAPGQKRFSFKVTADKGSKLFYYCAIHPWMQGKINVN